MGTILEGLALLLFAAPEIIFPRHLLQAAPKRDILCEEATNNAANLSSVSPTDAHCEAGKSSSSSGPLAVFIISHILLGIGSTLS